MAAGFFICPQQYFMQGKSIITIKEARKLLGKSAENLDDNQVSEIITSLYLIAKKYTSNSGSNNTLGV